MAYSMGRNVVHAPKRVPRLDELPQSCLHAADAHESGRDAGKEGEEQGDEGSVPQAHAHTKCGQHACGNPVGEGSVSECHAREAVPAGSAGAYGSKPKRQVKKTVKRLLYWVEVRCSTGTGLMPFSSTPASSSRWYHLGFLSGCAL